MVIQKKMKLVDLLKRKDIPSDVQEAVRQEIIEYHRLEDKYEQQLELFQSTFDAFDFPAYVLNVNDYIVKMVNAIAYRGQLPTKLRCYTLTHGRQKPCGGDTHICPLEEIKKTKKSMRVEHIHFDKSGNAKIVEVHAHPIFDGEGNVKQVVEFSFDITERRRVMHHTLEAVVQASPLAIILTDLTGNIKMWNPAAERIFGWNELEVIGHPNPLVLEDTLELLHSWGEILTDVENRCQRKDGSLIYVSISTAPLRNSTGKKTGVLTLIANITERKLAEEALRKSEERYRTLYKESPIGILN